MFELTGTINGLSIDMLTGSANLTLSVNEKQAAKDCCDELCGLEKLSIKIGRHRNKRSLDANAYFWVLCDKLSEKLKTSKATIYRELIKDIGGVSDIVCVKNEAADKLCEGWQKKGLGWQAEKMPSKIEGCTNVCLWYGSSTYDTAQMSQLIDNIVADCKEQGIETMTPEQIEDLKRQWENNKDYYKEDF